MRRRLHYSNQVSESLEIQPRSPAGFSRKWDRDSMDSFESGLPKRLCHFSINIFITFE